MTGQPLVSASICLLAEVRSFPHQLTLSRNSRLGISCGRRKTELPNPRVFASYRHTKVRRWQCEFTWIEASAASWHGSEQRTSRWGVSSIMGQIGYCRAGLHFWGAINLNIGKCCTASRLWNGVRACVRGCVHVVTKDMGQRNEGVHIMAEFIGKFLATSKLNSILDWLLQCNNVLMLTLTMF